MEMQQKCAPFEIKRASKTGEIEGYASVFDSTDQGGDSVSPGAFSKSLASGRAIKMLWQHNPAMPIGVWTAVKEDTQGLHVKGRILAEVQKGAETLALLRAGAISGMSIGYRTVEAEDGKDMDGRRTRKLKELDLWEVSLVTFPMNTEATVIDVKNLASLRDTERLLRDAGVPGAFAQLVAKYGYEGAIKSLADGRRDGDGQLESERAAGADLLLKLQGLKETLNARA